MKALVVDDYGVMRRIIGRCVEELGGEYFEAEDGSEALEILSANPGQIDLILLDVNMPVMSGFETLQHIKSNPATRGIPVIIVTTEGGRDDVMTGITLDIAAYVIKPLTREILIAKMKDVLQRASKDADSPGPGPDRSEP